MRLDLPRQRGWGLGLGEMEDQIEQRRRLRNWRLIGEARRLSPASSPMNPAAVSLEAKADEGFICWARSLVRSLRVRAVKLRASRASACAQRRGSPVDARLWAASRSQHRVPPSQDTTGPVRPTVHAPVSIQRTRSAGPSRFHPHRRRNQLVLAGGTTYCQNGSMNGRGSSPGKS